MRQYISYDDQGRVVSLVQNIVGLGIKTIDYTYDMLGNVLSVDYQKGTPDERFIHNYSYDAAKRLINTTTSLDSTSTPSQQAAYTYYMHGPLKRLELGNKLQGLDYLYTTEGALKGINTSNAANDPGKDGASNGFASDAFGFSLEYYPGDYVNVANNITSISSNYGSLYSGPISGVSWFSQKTVSSNLPSSQICSGISMMTNTNCPPHSLAFRPSITTFLIFCPENTLKIFPTIRMGISHCCKEITPPVGY